MKAFFLMAMLLCLVGCTHSVAIIGVSHTYKEDHILLNVVTNEDLREYENSKWAHFIAMTYNVGKIYKKDMNNSQLPFVAENVFLGKQVKNTTKYESEWKIPFKNTRSDINGTESYDLKKDNIKDITVMIYGATMGGNRVETLPFIVNLEKTW